MMVHSMRFLLLNDLLEATRLASRMAFDLAVDYEQHTGDQRADSRDDTQYSADTDAKKTQAGDY
jgi:hypothetical protein